MEALIFATFSGPEDAVRAIDELLGADFRPTDVAALTHPDATTAYGVLERAYEAASTTPFSALSALDGDAHSPHRLARGFHIVGVSTTRTVDAREALRRAGADHVALVPRTAFNDQARAQEPSPRDPVDEAGWESFPASDPPPWTTRH